MSKHTKRLLSSSARSRVFKAKIAYEKFLEKYPGLRGAVKRLEFSSEAPAGHRPWLVCDEGKVYFIDNVVFVELAPEGEEEEEDEPPVGPTGPPTLPPPKPIEERL